MISQEERNTKHQQLRDSALAENANTTHAIKGISWKISRLVKNV